MGSYLSVFRVFIENFVLSMRFKSLTIPGFNKEKEASTSYSEIEYPLAVADSSFQNLPDLLNETLFNISFSSLFNPVISCLYCVVLCRLFSLKSFQILMCVDF